MKENKSIEVYNLSKRYRIGEIEENNKAFRNIRSIFSSPLERLRKIRSLINFNEVEEKNNDVIWALKDVSFDINQGEVVGVIGANGEGKSTLLKILSRITHPTSGSIKIQGRVASLLEVGTGFHPELTGRENIYLNGTILGMRKSEIDEKLNSIIDFSGVYKFIDTPVKRYSSGMRVRLAFSVAVSLDPEILLIDEVLAVGDYEFQNKCLDKMKGISKTGKTIIFVSHNMNAIRTLCSRGILLKNNTVEMDAKSDIVIDNYLKNFRKTKKFPKVWKNNNQILFDDLKIKRIELRNSNDALTNQFDISDKITIILFYDVKELLENMRITIAIRNSDNTILFESNDSLCDVNTRKGKYRTFFTIPRNIFIPGEYDVHIGSGIPFIRNIIPNQYFFSFSVFSTKDKNLKFNEKYKGLISPRIKCRIEEWNY